MSGYRILVTPTSFFSEENREIVKYLERNGCELLPSPVRRPLEAREIPPLLNGVDGYIAGLDWITAEVIQEAPPTLRVISRYGVGYDRVDVAAAKEKGIAVTNTPRANVQAVADFAVGLMLSVARSIPTLRNATAEGSWMRCSGIELYGKTLGVIGMGNIGKAVIRRCRGFDMRILAYEPYPDLSFARQENVRVCALEEVLRESDVVTLHLPLSSKTKHILNAETIGQMKPGAILINTARGGLIAEDAALDALNCGNLYGLGIDVYEKEPPENLALLSHRRVVATPHAAAHTTEAVQAMAKMAAENLLQVLRGEPCRYIVNDT